jgi:hypothetical protein
MKTQRLYIPNIVITVIAIKEIQFFIQCSKTEFQNTALKNDVHNKCKHLLDNSLLWCRIRNHSLGSQNIKKVHAGA